MISERDSARACTPDGGCGARAACAGMTSAATIAAVATRRMTRRRNAIVLLSVGGTRRYSDAGAADVTCSARRRRWRRRVRLALVPATTAGKPPSREDHELRLGY